MIREALADFLREVRDGFDHFDDAIDWQAWLDNVQKNVVAATIVFCFVVVTGSCVAIPVIGLKRVGDEPAATARSDEKVDGLAHNPWSRDNGEGQPR